MNRSPYLPALCAIGVVLFAYCFHSNAQGFVDPVFDLREAQPTIPWSGRMNTIAIHPANSNEIMVTSESGGLWRSNDGGSTWRHVDSLPVQQTSVVAYWPPDPHVIIVTSGFSHDYMRIAAGSIMTNGDGIWISRDGGENWSHPESSVPRTNSAIDPAKCPQRSSAGGISIEPVTNKVYVATQCGVSYSTDGGVTWTHVEIPYVRDLNNIQQPWHVAIAALGENRVIVGGYSGIWYSTTGGTSWSREETGIGTVNDIHALTRGAWGVSHAFLVNSGTALFQTTDGGRTWRPIVDAPSAPPTAACGGIAFVRAAPYRLNQPSNPNASVNAYDLYYGNRCYAFQARAVVGGLDNVAALDSEWSAMRQSGHDMRDLIVEPPTSSRDRPRPRFMASDAGLEISRDGGRTFAMIGSGPGKLNAVQIMDVAGQRIRTTGYDLYFGTMDNDLWASPDLGRSWPGRRGAEGFGFQLEREVESVSAAKVTYTACWSCARYISGRFFTPEDPWVAPPAGDWNQPILLRRGSYVQVSPGAMHQLWLTTTFRGRDGDRVWTLLASLRENTGEYAIASRARSTYVVYHPIVARTVRERLFDTMRDFQPQSLFSVANIFAEPSMRTNTYSQMRRAESGPAGSTMSLGLHHRGWVYHPALGVNPLDPNHLIAPDGKTGEMRVSRDRGDTWHLMPLLNDLLSRSGTLSLAGVFDFTNYYVPLVTTISFNPERPDLVLVGAEQGGIYFSYDRGETWTHVPGSERISSISAFHWMSANDVYIGSYGRGLWKLRINLRSNIPSIQDICPFGHRDCMGVLRIPVNAGRRLQIIPIDRFVAEQPSLEAVFLVMNGRVTKASATSRGLQGVTVTPGSSTVMFDRETPQSPPKISFPSSQKERLTSFQGLSIPHDVQVVGFGMTAGMVTDVIVAKTDVALPESGAGGTVKDAGDKTGPAQSGPYLKVVVSRTLFGHPVVVPKADSFELHGFNFDVRLPLEISIDGKRLQEIPNVNQDGSFSLQVRGDWEIGTHLVTVEQRTENNVVVHESSSFDVVRRDEIEERKEAENKRKRPR